MTWPPDNAQHLARAQGHFDKGTAKTPAFGGFVIQGAVNRLRRQHRDQFTRMKKINVLHNRFHLGVLYAFILE